LDLFAFLTFHKYFKAGNLFNSSNMPTSGNLGAYFLFLYFLGQLNSCFQEVVQSAGTMLNKAEVTSSNLPPTSCVDMSKTKAGTLKESESFLDGRSKD
jgi:hypothetical protein